MTHTLAYRIQIDAPPEQVWRSLADFGGVYRYSPGVRSSRALTAHNEGTGAERVCQLLPAGEIKERILEWREGEGYTLEIFEGRGTPPFRTARATFAVRPHRGGSQVSVEFTYALKFGLLGALLNVLMVRRFVGRGLEGLLAGLKHHVETGEEVQTAKGLQLAAVSA